MEVEDGKRSEKKMVNNKGIKTALVVDDDGVTRKIHCSFLKILGFQCEQACNGKEAIDIHSSGKIFDLILMDLDMPILSGILATKKLREMGVRSTIAGVSSHSKGEEVQLEFIKAGLDYYVEKPLIIEKLIEILHNNNYL